MLKTPFSIAYNANKIFLNTIIWAFALYLVYWILD